MLADQLCDHEMTNADQTMPEMEIHQLRDCDISTQTDADRLRDGEFMNQHYEQLVQVIIPFDTDQVYWEKSTKLLIFDEDMILSSNTFNCSMAGTRNHYEYCGSDHWSPRCNRCSSYKRENDNHDEMEKANSIQRCTRSRMTKAYHKTLGSLTPQNIQEL
jgi:hypothetical protein